MLDAALLHEVIAGHDPMDSTSIDAPVPPLVEAARRADVTGLRIGIVRELTGEGFQPGVQTRFDEAVQHLSTRAPRSSRSPARASPTRSPPTT